MRNIFATLAFFVIVCCSAAVAANHDTASNPAGAHQTIVQSAKTTQDKPGATQQNPVAPGTAVKTQTPPDIYAKWNELGTKKCQQEEKAATVIGILAAVIAFFVLAAPSDLLRDSEPSDFGQPMPLPPGTKPLRRTFSLAQCQMAWWFVIVLASYIYLHFTQGDFTITGQVLSLMGIGTGTALGAAMVDQNKQKSASVLSALQSAVQTIRGFAAANIIAKANVAKAAPPAADAAAKLAALIAAGAPANVIAAAQATADSTAAVLATANTAVTDLATNLAVANLVQGQTAPKLASENFVVDVLNDVDGISLHRLQTLVWTLVLGTGFVIQVVLFNAFPEFDTMTLGLLGISAGVYLGFKVPEQTA